MLPLASAIKAVTDRAASIGGVPDGLWTADPKYWATVERDTYCQMDPKCGPGPIDTRSGHNVRLE